MKKMFDAFDNILLDSLSKGISIYQNPLLDDFICDFQKVLSLPETYDELTKHLLSMKGSELQCMGENAESILSVNMRVMKLKHYFFESQGINPVVQFA